MCRTETESSISTRVHRLGSLGTTVTTGARGMTVQRSKDTEGEDMPKRHFQISGSTSIDPYFSMLDGLSDVPNTLGHFISVRNQGTGIISVTPAEGSDIGADLSALLATLGSVVAGGGQWDLNVTPGLRFNLTALAGLPCSDVYVIMVPAG